MATPPHVPPKPPQPHQPDPRQQQPQTGPSGRQAQSQGKPEEPARDTAREERDAREKHEARAKEEAEQHQKREKTEHEHEHEHDDARKSDEQKKPKYPILAEGQAYQLFFNGHKIAREGDPPHQWLSMGRLPDSTPIVQSPMTPELEKKLKEGKFYLADGIVEDPQPPQPRRDPL
jgi:hypothetical protein